MPTSSGPQGRFLVLCHLDEDRRDEVAGIRPRHLDHVARHRDQIAFGGVVGSGDGPPDAVCYFLDVESIEVASAFVRDDPYAPLYRSVLIEPFVQRLPVAPEEAS